MQFRFVTNYSYHGFSVDAVRASAQLYLVLERRGYQKRKEDWNRGYTYVT